MNKKMVQNICTWKYVIRVSCTDHLATQAPFINICKSKPYVHYLPPYLSDFTFVTLSITSLYLFGFFFMFCIFMTVLTFCQAKVFFGKRIHQDYLLLWLVSFVSFRRLYFLLPATHLVYDSNVKLVSKFNSIHSLINYFFFHVTVRTHSRKHRKEF